MADSERTSYTVKITKDDDGSLYAEVLQLPGCFASGRDVEELREALGEAIGLYLSTEDVEVTVGMGEITRALRVIDGESEAEVPADVDFALAK